MKKTNETQSRQIDTSMKNIKNSYKSYEESPRNAGMTKRFYKNNNKFEVLYPDRSDKWSTICRYMMNFIESHIGESFDATLSTFLEKCKERHFSENLWGKSLVQEFIDTFSDDYRSKYYVDCSGNIQKKKSRYSHAKAPIVIEQPKILAYRYSEDNSPEVYNILYENFGSSKTSHICYDTITVDEYNAVTNEISISSRMHDAFEKLFGYRYRFSKSFKEYVGEKMFIPIKTDGIEYIAGTPEYNKYIAELKSSKRKFERDRKNIIEAERETLLYDIEQNRTNGNIEKTVAEKRIKFDEESFKKNYMKNKK